MKNNLTIACFYWGQWCTPHGLSYVRRLMAATDRHITQPHRFVCFTDKVKEVKKLGAKAIGIEHLLDLRWNLKKIYAHSRNNGLTGRVILLDLDIVIVDNVDELFSCDKIFITCQGAYQNKAGGSIISFPAGRWHDRLWKPILDNRPGVEARTKGSERLYFRQQLEDKMEFWQDLFPGSILSYKIDCKEDLPKGAKIVRFHGKPRVHEVQDKWVKENWI